MKKLLLLGVMVAWAPFAHAVDLPLVPAEDSMGTGIRMVAEPAALDADVFAIRLEANVDRVRATTLATERGEFTYLNIPGFQQSGEIGSPSLPVMNRVIEVPLGGTVEVEVLSRSRQELALADSGFTAPLFPRQPPQVKDGSITPFAYDRQSYLVGGFQQDALAKVEEIGVMRDMRLVLLKVAPVGYDAAAGTVEIYNDIELEVRVRGADLQATAEHKAKYFSPFFSPVRRQVMVPAALRSLEPTLDKPRCYAIVADPAFAEPLAPFVEWKREQGFDVVVAYTDAVGASSDAITTHVHDLYENPAAGRAAPDFLLLVGDHDNVPAAQKGSGWSGHISDLDFVAVTDDYIPDILAGRFSARTTAELLPQLQKTMEYEKFEMPDPSFLEDVVLTAGWDYSYAEEWGYPQIKYGVENYFNAENGFDEVSVFLSAGSHQNESEIISKVASGAAFVNYTAHGSETSWADPQFTIADVEGLGNEGQYPLVLANCCVTSEFSRDKCFGESWLRAPGAGAIGYIGGSNNTYWDEDLWFGNGFYDIAHPNEGGQPPAREDTGVGAYDAAFNDPYSTSGSMIPVGNLAVEQSNTSRKLYYWEVYHLFGDPSLQVYWGGMPQDNPVSHSGHIVASEAAYQVNATPHSYVGLSINGELLGAGFANAEGVATIALSNVPDAGEVRLVVTAKNRKPFFGSVTIGGEEP